MSNEPIPSNREAEILAILITGEKYGREIRDEYERQTNRRMPLGTLYVTLQRMEDKGYVETTEGVPTSKRRGHTRRYFKVTGQGQRVFKAYEQSAISRAILFGGAAS